MLILKKIESLRIKGYQVKRQQYIKYALILAGDFVIIWYINREKEKGFIRFQFNKGLCINFKNKYYNSTFILRSVIENIAIEQTFFYFSVNNIVIDVKPNTVRFYKKNNLNFLRKKKNNQSKFLV